MARGLAVQLDGLSERRIKSWTVMTGSHEPMTVTRRSGLIGQLTALWELIGFAEPQARAKLHRAMAVSTLAAAAEIASLLLVQRAAGSVINSPGQGAAITAFAMLMGAMLCSSLLRLLGQRMIIKAQYAVTASLTISSFARLQNQDYASYLDTGASRGFAAFEELQIVSYNALIPFIGGVTALGSCMMIMAMLTWLYPLAGSAILVLGGLAVLAAMLRRGHEKQDPVPELGRKRARLIYEGRTAFRDICLTNGQRRIIDDFAQIELAFRASLARTVMAGQTARTEVELTGLLVGLLALMALPWIEADFTAIMPALGVFALAGLRLLPQLAAVRSAASQIASHGGVTGAVRSLLASQTTTGPAVDAFPPVAAPLAFRDRIELSGIRKIREDRSDTLANLDLVIDHGSRVGIVGESGSGKSTLLDILCGLIPPSEGVVRIDGQPLTAANAAMWRERMGVVSQNALLVGDTLREAICYPVRPAEADHARLTAAATQTGLNDLAASLAHGLDTPLGETLARLSGGQRQRLALAHALYRSHDLLVLDEATSQLDQQSELVIRDCVNALPRELTVVLVTHRPALLDCCDVVYRLEGGKLSPWTNDQTR